MRAWKEVHWHDLKPGDETLIVYDGVLRSVILQETFRGLDFDRARGSVGVSFKSKNSRSTHYFSPLECTSRFYVRGPKS